MEEQWKKINNIPTLDYSVSNLGRVRNDKTNHILAATPNSKGYLRVQIYNKDKKHSEYKFVHRLVAGTFIPNPNNYPVVNHKDCNYTNNTLDNLEWCTQLYNMRYAKNLGRVQSGEDRPNSKLTWDEVKTIREIYVPRHREYGTRALARKYNVSCTLISFIVNEKNWERRDDLS